MARGVPAPDNDRQGKALFLYDGHNRKPGLSAATDTRRWLFNNASRWIS